MSLKVDVQLLSDLTHDNHAVLMMRLYVKSDIHNKAKIAREWPNLVTVYEAWYNGPEINEFCKGDDHIPDLPYD